MNKEQAKRLIKETFENSFNEGKFKWFIKNLLNTIEEAPFSYQGNYIPDPYKPYISSLKRIGKYSDGKNEIDILIVKLKKETSLERARTMQRNFIAWYLNGSRGGKLKDAALVAFVSPNGEDWRFSLVKMEYKFELTDKGRKVKQEFTPAKRWSFLVGKNEATHTPQSRLFPLLLNDEHNPTLAELEEAFNIEKVTKEFFEKYRELFHRTKEALDRVVANDPRIRADFKKKEVSTVDFAKKLLGQIVFLYFLQKKGWFGVKRDKEWGTGSKKFLRELFEGKHKQYTNFFNDVLEPLFYEALRIDRRYDDDYYTLFNCKIPFLNGGLFDPINNYDWVHTDILLPNELFSNKNRTKEGDIGDGILDIFDRYNFTVKEDEPLEREVAVDPEMLGKVFENLLEVKDRKSKGTYYTPREVVHYMCQESLINYLETELKGEVSRREIETLIKHGDQIKENEAVIEEKGRETKTYSYKLSYNIRKNAKLIDEKLANIKVADPAVGSGAFLVEMMHQIVKARDVLTVFIKEPARNIYNFKRNCIENSLYGVDIDPGAVEIAKLRLWLSLIVEEEDIKRIRPLPNLDYKIVCGDSLLSVEKDLLNVHLFEKLEKLKSLYFNETNPGRKQEYKTQIDEVISEITNGHKYFDFEVYFSEVFHQKGGFDIVIANPPYVQFQKNRGKLAKLYQDKNYETFVRTGDIYTLFYEKGIQLLKPNGILTFITSNKWMRAGYGEKLRKFFTKYNPLILIDLGPGVFESATVDTNILIIQKSQNENQLKAVTYNDKNLSIEESLKTKGVILEKLTKDAWFIGSKAEITLKEKIERIGKPLKDWDVNIYRGVLTGLNEAFIISTEKRDEILASCQTEEERKRTEAIIKPILRGRDIKRYYYEWAGLWVIGTFPALHLNIDDYPAIKKYFLENFDKRQLEQSGKKYPELGFNARKKTGNKWFETQDTIAYYPEFEKEKVVWAETDQSLNTVIVPPGMYLQKTCFMIITDRPLLINSLLNSKVSQWFIRNKSSNLGEKGLSLTKDSVQKIPLPPVTPSNQSIVSQIEELVDKIIIIKRQNPAKDTSELEKQIDQLVYKLYNLTPEEIKIVENSDKK